MIEVSRDVYDQLVRSAYGGEDREVCGILAGEFDDDYSIVTEIHPTENVAETPQIRYEIDPGEQLTIMEAIEERGLDLSGIYHSHPSGPPHPSRTDEERAAWPDLSYVIVSLDGYPYVGSWRWRPAENRFQLERLKISE